jgi:hypothetical protein
MPTSREYFGVRDRKKRSGLSVDATKRPGTMYDRHATRSIEP